MIKVLNLYAGIGGNRKLWENVEVTAVEYKQEIADIYKHFFPQDKVIVTDAHQYLLEHFQEYDFIWSSPPCPSHSRIRKFSAVARGQNKPIFPSMALYEEILFLQGYFKGKWVVENVISWYDPLIKPFESGSHYFWSNFVIPKLEDGSREHTAKNNVLEKKKGFDLSSFKNLETDKKLLLRNCVEPKVGLDIFNAAFKHNQTRLF
jgi:DNA (cytosine-5)-methyltransferase 1